MFFGVWDSVQGIADSFNNPLIVGTIRDVIYARYSGYGSLDRDYEMWARVLYIGHDGHLYEVHGSHCSCYGLEDQWEPEIVTIQAIVNDLKNTKTWNSLDDDDRRAIITGLVKHFPGCFVA